MSIQNRIQNVESSYGPPIPAIGNDVPRSNVKVETNVVIAGVLQAVECRAEVRDLRKLENASAKLESDELAFLDEKALSLQKIDYKMKIWKR
ncbi:unnamed protein product [Acanthoscelides obtectus]|uniref:Uncharacterized protein n=1 Tax=Acanthoscelides obtectus TaxID=200917 RepID=A0A9P0KJJ3_ACAOB|nr:unnamed protein product [Acanthoscelides obtectus]CAK1623698.1 hypothetical protein AOBTE_LOCUS2126 [Acanthoscelides obtectus]